MEYLYLAGVSRELRAFPPFRLDSANEQLWRGSEEIQLRRKTFAVLEYLVDHAGKLVTKSALLDAVWPDLTVSDSMPATSVSELRKALGDNRSTRTLSKRFKAVATASSRR